MTTVVSRDAVGPDFPAGSALALTSTLYVLHTETYAVTFA